MKFDAIVRGISEDEEESDEYYWLDLYSKGDYEFWKIARPIQILSIVFGGILTLIGIYLENATFFYGMGFMLVAYVLPNVILTSKLLDEKNKSKYIIPIDKICVDKELEFERGNEIEIEIIASLKGTEKEFYDRFVEVTDLKNKRKINLNREHIEAVVFGTKRGENKIKMSNGYTYSVLEEDIEKVIRDSDEENGCIVFHGLLS